jgi:hypothetical protein
MATPHPISKSKLAERVLRILNAGKITVETRVTQRDCELAVSQSRDESIVEYFAAKKSAGETTMPFDFLVERTITAEKRGNKHVATLPTRPLSIIGRNKSIFLVTLESDPSAEIFPTGVSHNTMFSGQPALNMEGEMYYTPFEQEIRIYGMEADGCKLDVMYVQSGEYFTSDEFFCIAPELQDSVVQKAIQMLAPQMGQEDRITDATGY